jgi:hypothetical protein
MQTKRQTILFHEEKKHSVLYKGGTGGDEIVTSIYIMKGSLEKPYPQKLTLILEPSSEA